MDYQLDGPTLAVLAAGGTRLIALRSAGFNNVDLASAEKLKMTVMRVPAYSPEAVAEHAVALMLALNRNIHHAYNRVREGNFDLSGLVGFNFTGNTVEIVGTGKIGTALAHTVKEASDYRLVGYDTYNNPACLALPEFRREVQCLSALNLLDFPFPGAAFASPKSSGRRRRRKENLAFPW